MSRNGRIALIAGALVVAVVAFIVISPGGDDDGDGGTQAAQTTPAQTPEAPETGPAETATEQAPPAPPVQRIRIAGGQVQGGTKTITVTRGEVVRIVITSDAHDELHLHGFDITREAAPGRPASFRFRADIEGAFELESHTAEDAGLDPLVARVVVEPS